MVFPSQRLKAYLAPAFAVAVAMLLLSLVTAPAGAVTPYVPDLWTWRNPAPSGNEFQGLSMTTRYDGWAVTAYGGIYATDDGGKHWWLRNMTAPQHLDGVHFVNSTTGFVVGNDGFVRRTTNGGAGWTRLTAGTSENLTDVHFVSTTRGWIVGDGPTIRRTTDGGATWGSQIPHAIGGLNCVTFIDEKRGWAGDDSGGVVRTTNGGSTWQRVVAIPSRAVDDVFFVNATHGWAIGGTGTVAHTTDGGITWEPQDPGTTHNLSSVMFRSTTDGWICTATGNALHTTDGGAHWTPVGTAGAGVLHLALPDGVHGCAIGSGVATTSNGGASWTRRDTDATESNLLAVDFANKLVGWAAGEDGTILATKDGGTTWVKQFSGTTETIRDIAAGSTSTACAVGWNEATQQGFIRYTENGGTTWAAATLPAGDTPALYSADFISAPMAWASGLGGTVYKTINGGSIWSKVSDGGSLHQVIDMVSPTEGWVGSQNYIAHSVDGGVTWNGQAKPATWPSPGVVSDVSFVDNQIGYACGANGHVMSTTDGGVHWTDSAVTETLTTMRGVAGVSAARAWTVSEFGFLFRTDNGGDSWSQQTSRTVHPLNAVTHQDGRVWVVGDGGMILCRGYAPAPFTVRAAPGTVSPGSTLTIYGWGYGSSRGASTVKIGTAVVTDYVSWTDMRIKVKVPNVADGKRGVRVTVGGTTATAVYVTVK